MITKRVSAAGLRVLKYFEGCELTAYPDPATGGAPWTIGWGHTGPEVRPGLVWTQDKADQVLQDEDLPEFEVAVAASVPMSVSQGQFDALVLWAFNCRGWRSSTLLLRLRMRDLTGAADEFPKWCRAGGRVMLGLKRRRAAERALFLGASADEAIRIAQALS